MCPSAGKTICSFLSSNQLVIYARISISVPWEVFLKAFVLCSCSKESVMLLQEDGEKEGLAAWSEGLEMKISVDRAVQNSLVVLD